MVIQAAKVLCFDGLRLILMYVLCGKRFDNLAILEKKEHFCTMKTAQSYTHPITLYKQRIKEEGIVALDDVRGIPSSDGPFVSPDYVICLIHRGHMSLFYDGSPDFVEQHTVGVIFPNHALVTVDKTDDYLTTLIVVDVAMMNDPMLKIISQLRYRYEPYPCVSLDRREYRMAMSVVEIMRETIRLGLPDFRTLLMRQLEFFLRLLSQ